MMATHKNLHELLKEEQEPFLLNKFIADRRSQLKTPTQITTLEPKKRKSIVQASTSRRNLCKHACFLSFHDSPDVCKSPFSDFPSPATSKSTPNRVRLQIPARTAALLLEAAMKIQKQSSKPRTLSVGFGLIGSILKRLSSKNRNRKCEISGHGSPIFPHRKSGRVSEENFDYENSRRNSTVWSESNGEEEKSIDLTSTSTTSDDSEIDYAGEQLIDNEGFSFSEKHFCSSPLSPFRFALERYPSPGRRTPIFSSPAASPLRPHKQENENFSQESVKKTLQEEEEEEKEQCSPVSVLDRQFEDYDDIGHEDCNEEDDYEMECSYATVQRSKLQLLQKLRRFEKLAELDPVELEKRMLEEYNSDEDETDEEDYEEEDEKNSSTDSFVVIQVLRQSGLHFANVSTGMKRLVLDLVAEEESSEWDGTDEGREAVVTRVCERLDSWNEVQSNTIDMMVELDFRRQVDGWKREDKEQVKETARDIEVAIFGMLMEELSQEIGLGC